MRQAQRSNVIRAAGKMEELMEKIQVNENFAERQRPVENRLLTLKLQTIQRRWTPGLPRKPWQCQICPLYIRNSLTTNHERALGFTDMELSNIGQSPPKIQSATASTILMTQPKRSLIIEKKFRARKICAETKKAQFSHELAVLSEWKDHRDISWQAAPLQQW